METMKNDASAKIVNICRREPEQKPKCASQRDLIFVFFHFFDKSCGFWVISKYVIFGSENLLKIEYFQ